MGGLTELPEPVRSQYEERYVEAIRSVGQRFLDAADLPAAWPYFRAIGEPDPVARALDDYQPSESDERLGQIIDVAFAQGANPRRGFELILDHYGTCSAITAFEQLPPQEAVRIACADLLVRQLHEHLAANLRADIVARGEPEPGATTVSELVQSRLWLFEDDSYHIDISHLSSTVRLAPMLTDPETIRLAIGLTDYGRNLSERHRYDGEPPFDRIFEDHAVYLRALIGEDVDAALAAFPGRSSPRRSISPTASRIRSRRRFWSASSYDWNDSRRPSTLPPNTWQESRRHRCSVPMWHHCARVPNVRTAREIALGRGNLVHYTAALLECGQPLSESRPAETN